ncbi:MAG: hypothetical protein HFE59_10685 [Clostridiales bacterium]|nr:hypothetical protein [Clostridiales bacterium]
MEIEMLKHLDKRSLIKVCFELLRIVDDYEVENFCLREKNEEFKSKNTIEQIRADAAEIRNESSERMLMKLINVVEKHFELSKLNKEQEESNDEKNNFKEVKTC